MFNFFKRKAIILKPEQNNTIRLREPDKSLFEKALKLYIIIHQKPHKELSDELSVQFKSLGNIVYSLIRNWLADGKPSLDYMAFLNEKIVEINGLPEQYFDRLEIRISEVGELELNAEASFVFRDEDSNNPLYLTYHKETGECKFSDLDG